MAKPLQRTTVDTVSSEPDLLAPDFNRGDLRRSLARGRDDVRANVALGSGSERASGVKNAPRARSQSSRRPRNMVWVPGATFRMGDERFYPEERPVHRVTVDGFWIDEHPVTVAEFRRFVKATGHLTLAERAPQASEYPHADPDLLVPGSLVFAKTAGPVDLDDVSGWWHWAPGAFWRCPEGPDSNVGGREHHPVVHVAYEDAAAYARWAGKELPTEAEWELAARGGLDGAAFAWGERLAPRGRMMANFWQGEFPWQNLRSDGFEGTSPVGRFPANGYGLCDMVGNVWEWTADYFTEHAHDVRKACCGPRNPRVTSAGASLLSGMPGGHIPRRTIKGGSHLCAPNYCLRFRPAARQGEAIDTSTGHIGFRCAIRSTPKAAQGGPPIRR
jgi:formylglycine-generating enzyme required for sulfatase activity